jgi:hypothetical protein
MPTSALNFVVSQRDRKSGEFTEWGELEFAAQPRIGELIKREVDGVVHVFLVVAVLHSDGQATGVGEIWVEDRGTLADLRKPSSAGSFGFLGA